ncbi:hypothetical protein Despr_2762 [Desulfobulbus propionicus DSM 2032]|jgi:hypothetical protein|uniref:Uncharacterized protein n=1 Tax=Desulfobulbus propionicus (strain ATCC 33891 / DSM 2032 / VKM B-1956 / 1pr3) TaxID=577650 RepID=A0A7U4DQ74_DESPD|nr:hypothetical protein [Desulfobulbus propionicus]ADW18896.1 hypothetical protein Despr_2762 [Desulfobulbus propionicus DSM 2032]
MSLRSTAGEGDGPLLDSDSGGWCCRCGVVHSLPVRPAIKDGLHLMGQLCRHQRIDWLVPERFRDPRCDTRCLFDKAGGKMFGVLSCRDTGGKRIVLRAFSGQYNGLWQVEGWVGPVFDVAAFGALVGEPEREIKRLGRELTALPHGSSARQLLRAQRRTLSRQLMERVHCLYQLVNFRGATQPLPRVFIGNGAPPSGTGDCCGPKLLHHAARHGLRPEAMAEFYWGASNASGTKVQGRFYPACAAKCQPILGFLLCGLP